MSNYERFTCTYWLMFQNLQCYFLVCSIEVCLIKSWMVTDLQWDSLAKLNSKWSMLILLMVQKSGEKSQLWYIENLWGNSTINCTVNKALFCPKPTSVRVRSDASCSWRSLMPQSHFLPFFLLSLFAAVVVLFARPKIRWAWLCSLFRNDLQMELHGRGRTSAPHSPQPYLLVNWKDCVRASLQAEVIATQLHWSNGFLPFWSIAWFHPPSKMQSSPPGRHHISRESLYAI